MWVDHPMLLSSQCSKSQEESWFPWQVYLYVCHAALVQDGMDVDRQQSGIAANARVSANHNLELALLWSGRLPRIKPK